MKRIDRNLHMYRPHQPFFEYLLPSYTESDSSVSTAFHKGIQFFGFHLASEYADQMFVFPDGCLDIVICCHPVHPSANVCGSLIHRRQGLFIRSGCDYFTIRFLPGYAEPFLKYPTNEFTEKEIPVEAVLPHAAQLLEIVSASKTFAERIEAFTQYYRQYYPYELEAPELVTYAVEKIIASRGMTHVNDLAAETGYSSRYLLNIFQRHLGVSPKLFSRIIRFQSVLHMLNQPDKEKALAQILELGYFDQNHFIKEFKEFGAETPRKYISNFPTKKASL